jgi:hypothetical protein
MTNFPLMKKEPKQNTPGSIDDGLTRESRRTGRDRMGEQCLESEGQENGKASIGLSNVTFGKPGVG